jgi:hypothetical protein
VRNVLSFTCSFAYVFIARLKHMHSVTCPVTFYQKPDTSATARHIYRVCINYRRISLSHNLSRKCRKIVKFVSITHSEHNIWNGPIVATAISREKRKPVFEGNGCLAVCGGVSWNLWRFKARSDGNLDAVVVLRRRSEGGMNIFVTEDASVIRFCKILR